MWGPHSNGQKLKARLVVRKYNSSSSTADAVGLYYINRCNTARTTEALELSMIFIQ